MRDYSRGFFFACGLCGGASVFNADRKLLTVVLREDRGSLGNPGTIFPGLDAPLVATGLFRSRRGFIGKNVKRNLSALTLERGCHATEAIHRAISCAYYKRPI
jgi:hypothetical protein